MICTLGGHCGIDIFASGLVGSLPTSMPNSPPRGIWASRLGFGPQGRDMGLEAEIWASRLGKGTEEKEEKE